ncbi:MAG: sigma-70 family RNA polymerase sigma factor [Rikenellaceae bacterium]
MEIEEYIIAEDSQLVEQVLEGDDIAFEYLFIRYREGIYRLLTARTGSAQDADDILQETFIKVYLNISRYDSRYTFGQWIYTIARNTFIDYKRRHKEELPIDESHMVVEKSTLPSPEDSIISSQQRANIESCMGELSQVQQQLFKMRFFEEFSYEEICEKLDMPMGTVKTNIYRARAKMCKLLIAND